MEMKGKGAGSQGYPPRGLGQSPNSTLRESARPPSNPKSLQNRRSLQIPADSQKSIRRFVETLDGPGGDPETPAGLASVVVNNHFDIEFFRRLVFKPDLARDAGKHPYFE